MLILTRRINETLIIGDEIHVTVLGIKGNQVRIGVDAPKEVTVHRQEVFDRIKQEKRERNQNPCKISSKQKKESIMTSVASQFSVDSALLNRAERGSAKAQLELGKILYRQN